MLSAVPLRWVGRVAGRGTLNISGHTVEGGRETAARGTGAQAAGAVSDAGRRTGPLLVCGAGERPGAVQAEHHSAHPHAPASPLARLRPHKMRSPHTACSPAYIHHHHHHHAPCTTTTAPTPLPTHSFEHGPHTPPAQQLAPPRTLRRSCRHRIHRGQCICRSRSVI